MNSLPWFASLFEQLMARYRAKRLHHGIVLIGSEALGRRALAEQLSFALLCHRQDQQPCGECKSCLLTRAGTHPDFHLIEAEKQIGIDAIRQGIKSLQDKAFLGHNKVMLIDGAETMTEASANALLKTLEEPTESTFILLLIEEPHRLLPTVLSRVEKQVLPSPDNKMLEQWLDKQDLVVADPSMLSLYRRAPLALKALLENPESANYTFVFFKQQLKQLISGQLNAQALAQHWNDAAEQALNWLQLYLVEANKKLSDRHETYAKIYQLSINAKQALLHNGVSKQLTLSQLFQNLVLIVKAK